MESPPTAGVVKDDEVVVVVGAVAALVALEDSIVDVLEVDAAETTSTVSGTEAVATIEVVGV